MATLQDILGGIGGGLQAFSAGVAGQGQQFTQGRQDRATKLSADRERVLLEDSVDVLGRLERGDTAGALGVLDSRLQALSTDPNADPSDTQGIKDLITSGNIQQAITELKGLEDAAIQFGKLKPRAKPAIPKVVKVENGVAIMQDQQTGAVTTQKLKGFAELAKEKNVQRSVNLPGGLVQLVYEDGTVELVEPSEENRKTIEAAEQRKITLKAAASKESAAGTIEGRGAAGRVQTIISEGVDAAQGIPILRRSLQLMERIETGGIDAASLRAKQLFGIEGADEGELSANLGRTVLGQLKATFGAAFTEKEGARLERMSAGFGKSAPANKRILRQSLKIATDAAERALQSARDRGDKSAVNDLLDFLDGKFDLTDESLAGIFTPAEVRVTPEDISSMTSEQLDAEIARQEEIARQKTNAAEVK